MGNRVAGGEQAGSSEPAQGPRPLTTPPARPLTTPPARPLTTPPARPLTTSPATTPAMNERHESRQKIKSKLEYLFLRKD